MRLYNTYSSSLEEVRPARPKEFRMYVCGITPYDSPHLGHARCYVVFDVLVRHLRAKGWKVRYVQNITDIDDKIIQRAAAEEGKASRQKCAEIAARYTKEFDEQMARLSVELPTGENRPRATEHISSIQRLIGILMERGFAYAVESGVYFSVRAFSRYGRLSGRSLSDLRGGSRVEPDPNKKDPLDFALWKTAKPGEPSWESPWGKGRPGWHIECSAMAAALLGETLDLHGGGQDLIFPHHENEIAQSEAATGQAFSRLWVHNGHVTIGKEKMSKSLGNIWKLADLLEKHPAPAVRLFLLSAHYRSPLEADEERLASAESAWEGLTDAWEWAHFRLAHDSSSRSREGAPRGEVPLPVPSVEEKEFETALEEDLNTEAALARLFQVRSRLLEQARSGAPPASVGGSASMLSRMAARLGLALPSPLYGTDLPGFVREALEKREKARKEKNFAEADRLRRSLSEKGYAVEDTAFGPRVRRTRE